MHAIIVGAGIGGLTAALSLHRIGISVDVYESVARIDALGVGINLLPHAVRELAELGLLDELLVTGLAPTRLAYFTKRGEPIWDEPRGVAAGYEWPQISIHRGELQRLLYHAVIQRIGIERIHTNCHLVDVQQHDGHVEASFVDKRSEAHSTKATGDVLIAAEGIHSAVRKTFYPN
jgi:5-methylphenazine-1-carboxylate 1-monooxygenase